MSQSKKKFQGQAKLKQILITLKVDAEESKSLQSRESVAAHQHFFLTVCKIQYKAKGTKMKI